MYFSSILFTMLSLDCCSEKIISSTPLVPPGYHFLVSITQIIVMREKIRDYFLPKMLTAEKKTLL